MKTSVYFYGDKTEHGRELLQITELGDGHHISNEQFKTILNEMFWMEGEYARDHKIVVYVFVGDQIVNNLEYFTKKEYYSWDDPSEVIRGYYFIDGSLFKSIMVAC